MSKNIEMNYFNGSTYEVLYPKTTAVQASAADRNYLELSRYGTNSIGYTGWIEVGRIRIVTTSRSAQSIVFLVLGNQNTKNGILSLLIRIDPEATISATLSSLEWLSVSDKDLVNKFALASEDGYAVLYAKVTSSWDFFHVGILGQAFDTNEFIDPSDSRLFKLASNYGLEGNHKSSITPILNSTWNPSAPYSLINDMSSLAYNTLATSDTLLIGDVSATQAKKVTVDEFTRYCPTTTSARTRPIQISTTDLTPKTSNLATGQVYLVYE